MLEDSIFLSKKTRRGQWKGILSLENVLRGLEKVEYPESYSSKGYIVCVKKISKSFYIVSQ